MNRWLPALALITVAALSGTGFSEEEILPSQKTKEAVDKLKKAPSGVGKSIETLKDAVREKLGIGAGGEVKTPAQPAADPLAVPEKSPERPEGARYSPAGKRDPFEPLALRAQQKRRPRENLSPLERYELGQLNLVGVVWDLKDPRAMVEDAAGLGYVVRVGTPIGPNDGKIKQIKPSEIVIE
ncbi:MAG TPA: pilus assembly protein PilP, partial [Candidatus Binatia bacterium]